MQKVIIDEATEDQLRSFALTVLGLDIDGRTKSREALMARITEAGWAQAHIIVPEEVQPGPARNVGGARNTRPGKSYVLDGETVEETDVRIMVHTKDGPGGERPVPVAVNGSLMLIPRGQEVWVPSRYVEALEHAEEYAYEEYRDGTGGLKAPRRVKAYPFSYV